MKTCQAVPTFLPYVYSKLCQHTIHFFFYNLVAKALEQSLLLFLGWGMGGSKGRVLSRFFCLQTHTRLGKQVETLILLASAPSPSPFISGKLKQNRVARWASSVAPIFFFGCYVVLLHKGLVLIKKKRALEANFAKLLIWVMGAAFELGQLLYWWWG